MVSSACLPRLRRSVVLVLPVAFLAMAGAGASCSNSKGLIDDAGPSSDAGARADSRADASNDSDSAGPGAGCPSAAPMGGATCTAANLVCEFGTATTSACDTLATCNGSSWQVTTPPPGDAACPAQRSSSCPASFASVPIGQHCEFLDLNCDYPEGRCTCGNRSSPVQIADASAAATWICPSPTPPCPLPRPRLGTACSSTLECDYGTCAIPGATAERCVGGMWIALNVACPTSP